MIPAIAFVGPSGVGKTTLLEKLIPELRLRGLRVAAVKHSGHNLTQDTPGKDSWRFCRCGGSPVVVASDETACCVQTENPIDVEALLRLVQDQADVALVEGFSRSTLPRIVLHRREVSAAPPPAHDALLAVVTDEPIDVSMPQYGFEDIAGLVDLLLGHTRRRQGNDVQAVVNGRPLPLKPFMQLLIARTALGMMSALKGAGHIRTLQLTIRNTTGKWGPKDESRHTDG